MAFTKDVVVALSEEHSEPSWVLERRLQAFDYSEKLEIPTGQDESWRYTDLRRLKFKLDKFAPSEDRPTDSAPHEALKAKGVIFSDINTAIAEHPELVQRYLFEQVRADESFFTALHAAYFSGGTFVYVPRGVAVELSLERAHHVPAEGASIFPHTLIVAEEGSEVVCFDRYDSAAAGLCVGATEIVVGKAARVTYVSLQEYEHDVWHFGTQRSSVARDATFRSFVATLGGRFSRQQVESALNGEHASSEMLGLYFAGKGQHFDFRTRQDHLAPECYSDLLYKGALRDDSRTVYAGVIHVAPGASKTDAYQTNRNLVLSDHAKADSKPELEIENNDVKCSHAASVSQLNPDELFYLHSRGIAPSEAERLVVKGFLDEVGDRVGRPEIRALVSDAVESELAG